MAPPKSAVWKYFTCISNELAKCNLCSLNFSRKGKGTTSLRNHLKSKHPNELKITQLEVEKQKGVELETPSTSGTVKKQQTIVACIEKQNIYVGQKR